MHILATLQRNGIRLATDDHTIHLVEEGAKHRAEVEGREKAIMTIQKEIDNYIAKFGGRS